VDCAGVKIFVVSFPSPELAAGSLACTGGEVTVTCTDAGDGRRRRVGAAELRSRGHLGHRVWFMCCSCDTLQHVTFSHWGRYARGLKF
jgi:hypothetical protein